MDGFSRMGRSCEGNHVLHNAYQRTSTAEMNKISLPWMPLLFPQSPTSIPMSPNTKYLGWQRWKLCIGSELWSSPQLATAIPDCPNLQQPQTNAEPLIGYHLQGRTSQLSGGMLVIFEHSVDREGIAFSLQGQIHISGMLTPPFMSLRNVLFIAMVCHMTSPLTRVHILQQSMCRNTGTYLWSQDAYHC